MPNPFFDFHRQRTGDTRSDSEILAEIATKSPELLDRIPGLRSEFDQLQRGGGGGEEFPPYEPTTGDYIKQATGSAVRGVANVVAGIPESIAIGAKALGQKQDVLGNPQESVEDLLTYKTGQAIRRFGEAISPAPVPELEKSLVATKIPAGLGSAAGFMVGGAASKALKVPGWLGISSLGAASSSVDFYQDAKAKGADDKTAYLSYLMGGLVGTSEALPLARMLNRLDKVSGGTATKIIVEAGKDTFEEALQELAQQFAQNYTAKKLYDKDRDLFKDLGENATVGGVTGFLFSLLTQGVSRRLGRTPPGVQDREEQPSPTAGQPALAAPAAPGVTIPAALKNYTEGLTTEDQVQLEAMARQELRGEPLTIEQRAALERNAALQSAYTIIRSQLEQAAPATEPDETQLDYGEGGELQPAPPLVTPEQPERPAPAVPEPDERALDYGAGGELLPTTPLVTPEQPARPAAPAPVTAPEPGARELDYGAGGELQQQTQLEGGEISDQKDKQGLPGTQPQGQATVAAQPQQTGSGEAAQAGGVLQAPKEITSPVLDETTTEDLIDDLDESLFEPIKTTHGHTSETGFFEVQPQPFSAALGERLTRNSRAGDSKSDTRQIAFFLDTETGEVIGLGTAKSQAAMLEAPLKKYRLGRLPGQLKGRTMQAVMESGRYVPIASMTRKTPGKYSGTSFRFANQQAFQAFAERAREKLNSAAETGPLKEAAKEYDEEGKATRVPTEETTPADVLAASEGFTQDEAGVIYDALSGVKPKEIGIALIRKLKTDPDLPHAMQVMVRMLENADETLTQDEIKNIILSTIALAKGDAGAGKKAFVQSITQRLGEQIRESIAGVRGGVQQGQAQPAAGAAAPAGVAGAEPSAAGDRGQAAAVPGDRGQEVDRFHRGTFEESYRPPPNDVAGAFQSAISALANAGYDVNLLQAEQAQLLTQFGQIDNANQIVSLVMANTAEPTVDNLYHLNAEIAHAVFAGLSTDEQARLQEAIRGATDEMLGVKGPFTIAEAVPAAQREAVQQEERLVDVVARNITANGFDAATANTLAQRFWRFLKAAILRTATALGKTWGLVRPQTQARLAADYLQVRVEQFLAGNIAPFSFTDFMGGGRTQAPDANARFAASNGATSVRFRFNPDTGQIEVQEVLADSVAAALSNFQNATVRYHGPKSRNASAQPSPDLGPEIIRYDVASNNEVKSAVGEHFTNWQNLQGGNVTTTGQPAMNPQQFSEWVLTGVMAQPDETIAGLNEHLTKLGQTPQNPNLRVADLNPEAQKNGAAKAYNFFSRLKARWGARYTDASYQTSQEPGSAQRRFDRKALRLQNLVNNYTDALYLFEEIKSDVMGWAGWLKDNAKRVGHLAHNDGVLEQIIRETEGRLDEPLSRDYYTAINKLVNRFANNEGTKVDFVEMLQSLAATGIPWEQMSAKQITEALRSPELEQATAGTFDLVAGTPTLGLLRESSMEGRALRSIAAAFLKKNAMISDFLALRASKAFGDRAEVNAALKTAMSDQRNAFQNARRDLKKTNKLNERATRLLTRLEEMQNEQRVTLDELARYRQWMDFFEGSTGLLTKQMAALEKIIGVISEEFEAVSGAKYIVPENPNEAPGSILNRKPTEYSVGRDGTMDEQLRKDLAAMQAWLDANQTTDFYGSNVYNRLASQVEKILENDMQAKTDRGSRSLMQAAFAPVTVKLEATGIPAFKALARQFRRWITHHDRYKQDAVRWATQWSNAATKARKQLGYGSDQFEMFLERYYDPAWDYISRRLDLQVGSANQTEAETKAYAALRAHYSSLTADQWHTLESFLRKTAEVSDELMKAAEAMGIRIKEDDANIFRRARGARTFEVSRSLHGTIRRIVEQMRGRPGQPGLWAGKPLSHDPVTGDPRDLAAEYQADPTKFRQDLAPLFAGEVWDHFVTPLANRSARAAFLAAPDAGGFARLATVDEARQALAATPKGDVVTFAEKLFDLTGGPALGADRAAFVAETIGTFNNYESWLHSMNQSESNLFGQTVMPVQQLLMNARESDELPAEWVSYRRYDLHSIRTTLNQLALHAAFGRNLVGAEKLWTEGDNQLKTLENEYRTKIINPIYSTPSAGKSKHDLRRQAKALAAAQGLSLTRMERASKDRAMAKNELGNFKAFVQSHGGVAMEFKWWSQLLSAAVAWTVQGPKTAFIDTTSLFKPIQEIGLSTQSIGWTLRNIKSTAMQNLGGFVEIFGRTIRWEADKIRMLHEMGQFPAADQFSIKERMVAVALANAAQPNASLPQRAASAVAILSSRTRELLNASIPKLAANPQFIALKPAAFTQMSQSMHLGSIMGTWGTFEDMVTRAARWLNNPTNKPERDDPTFRFDKQHAEALGYGSRFFGLLNDAAAFESLLAKLNQNGLTLEQLAKAYLTRGMTGPIMDEQSYERLMTIAPTELMQESSIGSRPSWMISNPIAHTALPLVGWSIAQTGSLAKLGRKELTGEWAGVKRFILKLTPIMGVGLAYALMADWYDEELLKKKSNRLTFTGDNAGAALIDKLALTGSLGVVGDFANSTINTSTTREVTLDSRVFAVGAIQGIWRALSTWYHQGVPSYSTVGRPLLQSMGGGGALQYLQIFNGLLGADNPESRATARINVNNWLRVAGRGADLEVKTGRGSTFVASRTTPWVREMALAAMAGDRAEFQAAYRGALAAARADKREDPLDYVKRAYQSQNPLRSVFESRISEREYRKLLLSMPDNGRQDVSEAMRLINLFGEGLGIEPYFGKKEESLVPKLDREKILRGAAFQLAF